MHPFTQATVDFARERGLVAPESRVLVALSGGPDSCALLLALMEAAEAGALPRPVAAAHLHHGMRGADADADAAFAAGLSARFSLPCQVGLGAVPRERAAGAGAERRSPQDAAREARYRFLEAAARDFGADTIATAHTADDQAETVLLRVLRGAAPDGLGGIPAARVLGSGLRVVRPLLGQTRGAVEAFCRDRGVIPRRDPSNEKADYARGRVRALLPRLEQEFNPRVRFALRRLADAAGTDADLLRGMADALWRRVATPAARWVRLDPVLRDEHPALRRRVLLRALLRAAGGTARSEAAVTGEHVEILDLLLHTGRGAADLAGGVRAESDARGLTVSSPVAWGPPAPFCYAVPVPGQVWVRPAAFTVRAAWDGARPLPPARRSRTVQIAYGTIGSEPGGAPPPLVVRSARAGDRIAPLGMGGRTRPVTRVMADAGWPEAARASAPLVARADTGEVWWVVGLAQAEATRVTPGAGAVLRLTAEPDC